MSTHLAWLSRLTEVVVAGGSSYGADFKLARYHSDGSLDTSFDTDGKVITDLGTGRDWDIPMAIQPDGKLVVAGMAFQENGYDVFAVACTTRMEAWI